MVAAVGGHLAFTATILHLVTNIHYNCSCGDKKIPVHRPRVEFLLYYSRQLVLHVTLEVCGIDIRILQIFMCTLFSAEIMQNVFTTLFKIIQGGRLNDVFTPFLLYVRLSKLPRGFSCKGNVRASDLSHGA